MRLTPSREQLDYLHSIGATNSPLAQPRPPTAPVARSTRVASPAPVPTRVAYAAPPAPAPRALPFNGLPRLLIAVVVVIVVIAILSATLRGQEAVTPATSRAPSLLKNLLDSQSIAPSAMDYSALRDPTNTPLTISFSVQQRPVFLPDLAPRSGSGIPNVFSPSRTGDAPAPAPVTPPLTKEIAPAPPAPTAAPSTPVSSAVKLPASKPRKDFAIPVPEAGRQRSDRVSLLLIGCVLLVAAVWWHLRCEINNLRHGVAFAVPTGASPTPAVTTAATTTSTPQVSATRQPAGATPSAAEQLDTIALALGPRGKTAIRTDVEPWTVGLATLCGNVRSENQDNGLAFQVGDTSVVIVADGCGGLSHGQRAALLASTSAAASIASDLTKTRWVAPDLERIARTAIDAAAHRLAVEGDKLNIKEVRGGLRTTLIVVVAHRRELGFAYIGDGGGIVLRPSGEQYQFLEPQKASGMALNVLAASLGPVMEGRPKSGRFDRMPGELVLIGSDGVFDRVPESFAKDVLRGCISIGGDLRATADRIVTELADVQDPSGYVCDDNLTLGLLGDGTPPKLQSGFWSNAPKVVPAPGPEAVLIPIPPA